jgi:short-subunit dehydrogenase
MRVRRRGHIINISSMAGLAALPGIAYYTGSKFALEGISEVLSKEVRDFGIHVTAIAPGSFRTAWAGSSMVRSDRSIADYDTLFDPIRRARENKSGRQMGDPAKAAKVLLDLVEAENPPVHLILGVDALRLVRDRAAAFLAELDAWEAVSLSTEYSEVEAVQ